ncbi:alpha/beta-hydrolase [Saccharata proteae CBS 121410]|uniref:Alpha/beta-hydrolase n=1 Tax=Saccharata proteae CBS 121410 TaxID=1314787 RepID=A0A6A5YBZ7_9PEZI|nr:alpha/beta-hydrolase [Saccharata proteae CBS 121410]
MPQSHIVPATATHTYTLIFLHGRDSTASEFAEELFESQASDDRTLPEIFPNIKWVFPQSAIRKSARFGAAMSQWFDIWSLESPEDKKEIQQHGLSESIELVRKIIDDEAALVGAQNVILAGISQGCATAIHALLQGERKIGAFVGLAGWLPFRSEMDEIARCPMSTEKTSRLRRLFDTEQPTTTTTTTTEGENLALHTPVLLTHCSDDDVISIHNGEELRNSLTALGMSVEWRAYQEGGHWVNEPQGVDDIVMFLGNIYSN